MLSRVANALYWAARNIERTENNAFVLSVQLVKMLEESGKEVLNQQDWVSVIDICASKTEYDQQYDELRTRKIVDYLAFSEANPNSLVSTTYYLRESAKMTRDTIPNELWEVWNDLYLFLQQEKKQQTGFSLREIHFLLQKIKTTAMTSTGIIDTSMTRDLSYYFIKIGKWVERAEKTARIMQVLLRREVFAGSSCYSEYAGRFTLQLVNGVEDFSKKYRLKNTDGVIQYLVSDRTFPRSIYYCMSHIKKAILEIELEKEAHYSREMFAALSELLSSISSIQMKDLSVAEMENYISKTLDQIIEFGKIFSRTYYLIEPDVCK